MAAELARTVPQPPRVPGWLVRAAILAVFDIEWIEPEELDDAGEDELAEFLAASCERVADASGTARWQLRDEERARVLRTATRDELREAWKLLAERAEKNHP